MRNRPSIQTILLYLLICTITVWHVSVPNTLMACDIAVISGKVTTTGRPILWKNRDHSAAWQQELVYYDAVKPEVGASLRIMDRSNTWLDFEDEEFDYFTFDPVMSGGVNESGFAITNTTVYEDDPIHEYLSNANVYLMEQALEKCRTVKDFDDMIKGFKANPLNFDKVISGNFVVLDAQGGAALYELYSGEGIFAYFSEIQVNKLDANNIVDAPHGFVNHTNSNEFIPRTSDDRREERGHAILETLYQQNALSVENILIELAKDVCEDDIVAGETLPSKDPDNNDPSNFNTGSCISRYQTNFAMVVDGVANGESPEFTTLWLNFGEPSVGVSTPHFVAAHQVTPYVWAESDLESANPVDESTTCALNQMINDCELTMYSNNIAGTFEAMDSKIDYPALLDTQAWTIPLEKDVIKHTYDLLDQYRSGLLPEGKTVEKALYDLSHYAAGFVYTNYTNQSASFETWNFGELSGGDDLTDDDNVTVVPSFTQFMIWLLTIFSKF